MTSSSPTWRPMSRHPRRRWRVMTIWTFAAIAEDAGVELSYHTEMSQRAMPPPGGMRSDP